MFEVTTAAFDAIDHLEARSVDMGWEAEYRQMEAGRLSAKVGVWERDGVGFHHQSCSRTLEIASASPPQSLVFVLKTSAAPIFLNGRDIPDSGMLIATSGQHCDIVSASGASAMTVFMSVGEANLELIASIRQRGRLSNRSGYCHVESDPLLTAGLRQFALSLSVAGGKAPAGMIEAEIRHRLHAIVGRGQPARGESMRAWSHVLRVRRLIDSGLHRPLAMRDLCNQLNVSPNTLARAFHRTLEMTPTAYVRSRRLDKARRRLSESGGEKFGTVSSVALDCGFQHLSRFSAAYRAQYGISPRETPRTRSPATSG